MPPPRPAAFVVVIIIIALFALLVAGCEWNQGVAPPEGRIFFPTGLAVDGEGRYLYVANSNGDIAFNGGTLLSIDLAGVAALAVESPGAVVDEADFVVPRSTVATGTYAKELALTADGTRLFATIGGDSSLTFADVTPDASRLLTCSDDPEGAVPTCSGRFVLGSDENQRGLRLPNEPFGIAIHDDRLFVTHADGGEVAMFGTITGTPDLMQVSDDFPAGSIGIAIRPGPPDDPSAFLGYVTSRDNPVVTRFDVAGSLGIEVDEFLPVDIFSSGIDQRGIAFSHDDPDTEADEAGQVAYVVSRAPESLLLLDTRAVDAEEPEDAFVGAVEVGRGPAGVTVDPRTGLVYVLCFTADQIFVVDPELREVVDIVLTGQGPQTLVFDPTRPLAYVSQFTESTLAVIDVDAASATYHQSLATIGVPDLPETAR